MVTVVENNGEYVIPNIIISKLGISVDDATTSYWLSSNSDNVNLAASLDLQSVFNWGNINASQTNLL